MKPVKDKLEEETKKVKFEMGEARKKIEKAIDQNGPYSHNMIGATLRSLADKTGYKYANELVREFDLDELYGISEIEE